MLDSNRCIEYPFLSSEECVGAIKYTCDKNISLRNEDVVLQDNIYASDQVTTANYFKYNFFEDNPNYIDRLLGVLEKGLPWLEYPISVRAWVNLYETGQGIDWHAHNGMSGHSYSINIFLGGNTKPGISYLEPGGDPLTIENKLGAMLISNCSLWHMVPPNESKETRYTVGITIDDYEAMSKSLLRGACFNAKAVGAILLTD
tara:strand:+ start:2176 stop:2781 length:606 start_codon:yes stop_codon:yes gene_type:complete